MMITVIRHTGLGGNTIAIKLNGKKVATIYPEQQIRVELPEETATLRVSEWGFKSKTIEVQDGETIEIILTAHDAAAHESTVQGVYVKADHSAKSISADVTITAPQQGERLTTAYKQGEYTLSLLHI